MISKTTRKQLAADRRAQRRKRRTRAALVGAGIALTAITLGSLSGAVFAYPLGDVDTGHNAPRTVTVDPDLPFELVGTDMPPRAVSGEWKFASAADGAEAEGAPERSPTSDTGGSEPSPCIVHPLNPGVFRHTSPFGSRTHPISGHRAMHSGTDLAAPVGSPIHAVADGQVVYAGPGFSGRSSNVVVIAHNMEDRAFWSWYVHMYDNGVHVTSGQWVKAGERIASVGSNGNSTGPHLHLEIHTTPPSGPDTATDPLPFLAGLGYGLQAPGSC